MHVWQTTPGSSDIRHTTNSNCPGPQRGSTSKSELELRCPILSCVYVSLRSVDDLNIQKLPGGRMTESAVVGSSPGFAAGP